MNTMKCFHNNIAKGDPLQFTDYCIGKVLQNRQQFQKIVKLLKLPAHSRFNICWFFLSVANNLHRWSNYLVKHWSRGLAWQLTCFWMCCQRFCEANPAAEKANSFLHAMSKLFHPVIFSLSGWFYIWRCKNFSKLTAKTWEMAACFICSHFKLAWKFVWAELS